MYGECVTIRGSHHIDLGKPCQDASGYYHGDEFSICIIADGHGGQPHYRSGIGSKLAIESAIDVFSKLDVRKILDSGSEKRVNKIIDTIIAEWNKRIQEDYRYRNKNLSDRKDVLFSESELLYGTTLLIGYLSDEYCFGFRIGDGSILLIDEEGVINSNSLLSEDYKTSQTDSLSTFTSIKDSDYFIIKKAETKRYPKAIIACTDGIDGILNHDELIDNALSFVCGMYTSDFWYYSVIPSVASIADIGTDDCSLALILDSNFDFEKLFENYIGIHPDIDMSCRHQDQTKLFYTTNGELKQDKTNGDTLIFEQSAFWSYEDKLYHSNIRHILSKVDDFSWNIHGSLTEYQRKNTIIKPDKIVLFNSIVPTLFSGEGKEIEKDSNHTEYISYEGPFVDCERQGEGIEYYSKDGRFHYKGDFLEGKYHGQGLLYNSDGTKRYEGGFSHGKFDGRGTFFTNINFPNEENPDYDFSATIYPVISHNGLSTGIYPEWDSRTNRLIYIGGHMNGKKHGYGIEITGMRVCKNVCYSKGKLLSEI